MTKTFFFYDLETSGLSARDDRIMQFAGQRTDLDFNPIGDPVNELIRLSDDTLPSPEALCVTGITPQSTIADGYSEAEFARIMVNDIFTPDTIAVGFNNIRFDDEFIRHFLWRNFYDPYEWAWKDGRSRWDILDVVRMTRALRPDGIEWPVTEDGKATNRLELLTKLNGVDHYKAHDALSDVMATIEVAKLIQARQPQLFSYLLKLRDKREVMGLVNLDDKRPFVYTSGRYDAEHDKTTVAFPLTAGRNGNVVVYDLRYDPSSFIDMDQKQLADIMFASWEERKAEGFQKLPVKELQYNRAPAVAPLGVLEQERGWDRIHLDLEAIERHKKLLLAAPQLAENIRTLLEGRPEFKKSPDPEAQLYDGFVGDKDKIRIESVRNANERELADFHPSFDDERLPPLLLHYKARNYPTTLSEGEVTEWEAWRSMRIAAKLPLFMKSLTKMAQTASDDQQFILQELQLWAESIAPAVDD
ncbi:exodeoxyribonuclease I [Candidatus Saccharibacteria bacterium 32-50-13]|nr:MAG: exodeoxyribonuclease I [Candidatus Saccharibacteria bacterium 32-50-13]